MNLEDCAVDDRYTGKACGYLDPGCGAATAGSLLPTPGGIGGVEAALIAGLTAAGMSMPVATAATVLSRLVAVWLPAIPGWWAAVRLRKAGLL